MLEDGQYLTVINMSEEKINFSMSGKSRKEKEAQTNVTSTQPDYYTNSEAYLKTSQAQLLWDLSGERKRPVVIRREKETSAETTGLVATVSSVTVVLVIIIGYYFAAKRCQ